MGLPRPISGIDLQCLFFYLTVAVECFVIARIWVQASVWILRYPDSGRSWFFSATLYKYRGGTSNDTRTASFRIPSTLLFINDLLRSGNSEFCYCSLYTCWSLPTGLNVHALVSLFRWLLILWPINILCRYVGQETSWILSTNMFTAVISLIGVAAVTSSLVSVD
jgi:hypothetical protein